MPQPASDVGIDFACDHHSWSADVRRLRGWLPGNAMESRVFQLLSVAPHDLALSVFFPPSAFVHKHALYHQQSMNS